MAEYVDKAEVLKHCSYYDRKLIISEDLFLKLPAIDVSVSVTPDIVHCSECKYAIITDTIFQCVKHCGNKYADWFCADGERGE